MRFTLLKPTYFKWGVFFAMQNTGMALGYFKCHYNRNITFVICCCLRLCLV